MAETDVQMLRGAYEAFGTGDIEKVLSAFHEDVEWAEPDVKGLPWRGIHNGPKEVGENVFAKLPQAFDEFDVDARDFIDGGDTVVVTGRFKGVGRKTGEKLNVPFAHVYEMREGKVKRFRNYTDTAGILGALYDTDKDGYPRVGLFGL